MAAGGGCRDISIMYGPKVFGLSIAYQIQYMFAPFFNVLFTDFKALKIEKKKNIYIYF